MRAALVNENGLVVNTISIEEGAEYTPPNGLSLVYDDSLNIGDSFINGVVQPKSEPELSVIVPKSVTPLQARRALRAAGLLDTVNSAIASSSGDVQDAWEYATEIQRNDPLITTIGISLGLTEQQIDQLFIQANEIV